MLSSDEDLTVTSLGQTVDWQKAATGGAVDIRAALPPGTLLSGRYEILQLLGQGGMGAVYKARDVELDRLLAVKVIRPELAGDQKTLQRFKQELILARQVTHKNVIRIFDLGTHEGIKFITMEFVEGRDLSSLLEERRFAPDEAARIVRQVCRALEAAHAENVIHRDLKPQNIMVDETGRVCVMDFGLARSVEVSGLTQTGAVLGTPAYMSPEQAKGSALDARSDLFSLGIIFFELLTGQIPFQADTMWGTLLKRTQEPAPDPRTIVPDLPQDLSEMALRCLATDPAGRYQNATELALLLDLWIGDTPLATVAPVHSKALPAITPPAPVSPDLSAPPARPLRRVWKTALISAAGLLLAVTGYFGWLKFRPAAAPPPPTTVMIADINNHTGDPVFDGTLEPVLRIGLEGATFISAYDRTQLRSLGLRAVSTKFDDTAARKTAVSQGLAVVVSGSLEHRGPGYALSVRATQAVTGNLITNAEADASNRDQVLFAATKVASAIRTALGDATSESARRFAMETLTATSLEAVHEYAAAMDLLSSGKFDSARQGFSRAVDLDPNFGLAYAGMAVAARNTGAYQDAEKYVRQAIQHIDHMTERERYRTRGMFYVVTGDQQKCTEEYSALVARYSADVSALNNLGGCYAFLRNIPKATEEMSRAAAILPKRAVYRFNLALYHVYAGEFAKAEGEVRAAQPLSPSYIKGYVTLAYAQLGQGNLSAAAATYRTLAQNGARGATLAALGLADLAVYSGRYAEAAQILEKQAAAEAQQATDAKADEFIALANVQALRGEKAAALAAVDRALANSKEVKFRFLAARALTALGETAQARMLAASLAAELQAEPQAYAKLIEGEGDLKQGDSRAAVRAFTDGNNLLDTWIGRFDLGRAYLEAGAFTDADSQFDRCNKRRGEAMELFMDDVPTYGYFPPVYYYVGRVREGMKSAGFADSYRAYLQIRDKAGEDPLLPEVRRRAGR